MSQQRVRGFLLPRHDTAENWAKAKNFIPEKGEIIIFDADTYEYGPTTDSDAKGNEFTYKSSTNIRFKIGDGVSNVNVLPFYVYEKDNIATTIYHPYDLNHDGVVDDIDQEILAKYHGGHNLPEYPWLGNDYYDTGYKWGDISSDGNLNLFDLVVFGKYVAGEDFTSDVLTTYEDMLIEHYRKLRNTLCVIHDKLHSAVFKQIKDRLCELSEDSAQHTSFNISLSDVQESYIIMNGNIYNLSPISDDLPTVSKSLVFDTEEDLNAFINGNEKLAYYEKRVIESDVVSNASVGTFTLPIGEYYINAKAYGIVDSDNFNMNAPLQLKWSEVSEPQPSGKYTFSEETTIELLLTLTSKGTDPYQPLGFTTALTIEVQADIDSSSSGTSFLPYIREDGVTKEDLNIGDILVVDTVNSPDYFWNGTQLVELCSTVNNIRNPEIIYHPYDLNHDGVVDNIDQEILGKYFANWDLSEYPWLGNDYYDTGFKWCDISGDGTINLFDLTVFAQYLKGERNTTPVIDAYNVKCLLENYNRLRTSQSVIYDKMDSKIFNLIKDELSEMSQETEYPVSFSISVDDIRESYIIMNGVVYNLTEGTALDDITDELSNRIALWQPETDYKVGDVVIATYKNAEYNYTAIAICNENHTSAKNTEDNNGFTSDVIMYAVWDIASINAKCDSYGRIIVNTYATKEETMYDISPWQPNTEYKVGDVVIGNLYTDSDELDSTYLTLYRTVIARCISEHIPQTDFNLIAGSTDPDEGLIEAWEVLQETYAYYDALGNRIHTTYATKEEVTELKGTKKDDDTTDETIRGAKDYADSRLEDAKAYTDLSVVGWAQSTFDDAKNYVDSKVIMGTISSVDELNASSATEIKDAAPGSLYIVVE